jgi:DNA invertase Pin-like site-specific DNA recombinase
MLYARVSSKDQEAEGFIIPARLRMLREYAVSLGFASVYEFIDVDTAKETGRTNFGEMLAYLNKHCRVCRTILVEQTNRLYRIIKGSRTVDRPWLPDFSSHFAGGWTTAESLWTGHRITSGLCR